MQKRARSDCKNLPRSIFDNLNNLLEIKKIYIFTKRRLFLGVDALWTLCGRSVAVQSLGRLEKSTCGGSRRRVGPGSLGPQGPRAPWGPARLLELPQVDFFSFSWTFNGHGTATQCPHSVHTQEKSSFFRKNLEFFLFRRRFFRELFSIVYRVFFRKSRVSGGALRFG